MSEKDFVDLLNRERKELIENLPQVKQLKQELEGLKEDNKRLNELLVSGTESLDYWTNKYLEEQAKNTELQKQVEQLLEERVTINKDYLQECEEHLKTVQVVKELQTQVDELKERLHIIFALGFDYDGCDKAESLKGLIDELVKITQMDSKEFADYYKGVEVVG